MMLMHRFRAGLYGLVCLATFCLWLGEDDPALPYPWLFILWAVATYAFTDVWEKLVLPRGLASWLGVAAVGLFAWEEVHTFFVDPVMPLGHLLVCLQVLVLAHVKKPALFWNMLVMSFLQMMIAALHNHRLLFGVLLIAYLTLLVWTLTQFLLVRESLRHGGPDLTARSSMVSASALPGVSERYAQPKLRTLNHSAWLRQLVATLRSSGFVLATTLALFLLIPRGSQTTWRQPLGGSVAHVVGFDEQVRLGQLGTILDNSDEVMTVQLFDEKGEPYKPVNEPLWRGVALQLYRRGRWQRPVQVPQPSPWGELPAHLIRQEIRLQAIHPEVVFGMRPAYEGQTREGEPLFLDHWHGTLFRPNPPASGPLQYTLLSGISEGGDQPGELEAWRSRYRFERYSELTQVPGDLREPLTEYVSRVVPPEVTEPYEICQRLLVHLQDPTLFRYSLEETVVDPSIDPVLDFLRNRRAGHCEYFASALVLMLRVRGVPARMVNGFKGGDWTELLGKFCVVRQRHAHSWVEAIVSQGDSCYWTTLDPTPGQARQQFVAQMGWFPLPLRQLYDASRHIWSSYVLNFNAAEQEAVIYDPIRQLSQDAPQTLGRAWTRLCSSPQGRVALAGLWLLIGLVAGRFALKWWVARMPGRGLAVRKQSRSAWQKRVFVWAARWLGALWTGGTSTRSAARSQIAFYEKLLRLFASHGVIKLPTWTPLQFAEQAGQVLRRQPDGATAARIPAELIDCFYHARFGQHRLGLEELAQIDLKLRSLAEALSVRTER